MVQNLINFSTNFKYNGLSNQKIIINYNKVFKYIKLNNKTKKIINWLLSNNNYIPNITIFSDYISYDLIAGYTFTQIGNTGMLELKSILSVLQSLQKLKYKNKYIVHGDLSPVNVIFEQDLKIKKIIDWDNVKLGSKYQDPAYVFWLWINFGGNNKSFSEIKKEANVLKTLCIIIKKTLSILSGELSYLHLYFTFVFLIYLGIIFLFSFFSDNLIKIIDGYNYNDQIIFFNLQLFSKIPEVWSYKENKGFIKIRKKIPLIYWTK